MTQDRTSFIGLLGRICHGSYHWRCVRPETISHYGENTQFICEKCHEHMSTNGASTHRLSNGGIRIKSPDSSETDYRQFVGIPSKFNGTSTKDTTVINTVRYFEDKQQHASTIPKVTKSNGHHNGKNHITPHLDQRYFSNHSPTYFRSKQGILRNDNHRKKKNPSFIP